MPLSDFLLQRGDLFSNVPKSKVNISDGIEARKTVSKGLLGENSYSSLQIYCYLCFPLLYRIKKNPEIHEMFPMYTISFLPEECFMMTGYMKWSQ